MKDNAKLVIRAALYAALGWGVIALVILSTGAHYDIWHAR
jgi:hypothetical protein